MKRFLSQILAVALSWLIAASPALGATIPLMGVGSGGNAGPVTGDPTALAITSSIWTSATDLTPVSQFVDGYTGDLTLQGITPAGSTGAYAFGTDTAPKLSVPVTRPGYSVSGGVITSTPVNDTIWAKTWLRQTYANETLPTESANGGNAKIAISFNGTVYASDTVGTATALAGLYTSGVASNAKSGIPVTNGSSKVYPLPIGAWINPPGERIGSGQNYTVEFTGGQAYGKGGLPLGGVVITAYDAGAAHSVAKTVGTMSMSARQVSTSCTGTNGSATLTSCADTSGFIVGMRLTVPGIPGQPRVLSKTSSTLVLGSNQTCVTTLNSGNVTVGTVASLANGDALADGGFVGATLTDANITSPAGVATINAATVTADITTASKKSTAAVIHTNATAVTAAAAHACTINHVFQGSTGSVTVTAGNPVPVFSATFTAADFTGASFADGLIYFRAQAYPVAGDQVLDTQTGADGTRCDWFVINVLPCNSSSAAWFNIDGTDISQNLHNLWAYYDTAGKYAPAYVWVKPTGTCTTTACVSTSPTDPGGGVGNYAASAVQAQTNLKAFYNALGGGLAHNDPQGGVICLTAATYAGFGGSLATNTVIKKPPLTITSALAGGDCPLTGAANSDLPNVILDTNATQSNRTISTGMRLNNVTFNGAGVIIQASDSSTAAPTAFVAGNIILSGDRIVAGASSTLFQIGNWSIYNSVTDEGTNKGDVLAGTGSKNNAPKLLFGSTLICGSFTTAHGNLWAFNVWGNIAWGCSPASPPGLDTAPADPQALSVTVGFNKFMGMLAAPFALTRGSNILLTTNVGELINDNTSPAEQISGDNINVPMGNMVRVYETETGARTNNDYLEGIPNKLNAVATGGAFPANTYYVLVSYARVGNPTVETSTDGINVNTGTFSGTAIVLNGSATLALPCDPNYVATIYVDSTITGANGAATLGHYAKVGGVDAKQLATCQTVTITDMGSAHTSPSVNSLGGHNELKGLISRFNIDEDFNMKSDWYGSTTGQSGAIGTGSRVGNFQGRFRADWIGNVAVAGTKIGSGYGPNNGLGEAAAWLDTYNPTNTESDLSWVKYMSDRSFGSNNASTPTSPALNLGHGNLCIDTSVTNPLSRVPAGLAAWPSDIQGRARLNDGTGAAGAYERGCT